ncbi:hypothetical protein [uncultured Metabacillus sp.]|uniref:hypothetical protein n=1 Tax=uncultured Metabacillus sp. TaxID=2860135 RepID=UPI002604602B|nr:hypothetical protein [uncultured Metabacillus sp.]
MSYTIFMTRYPGYLTLDYFNEMEFLLRGEPGMKLILLDIGKRLCNILFFIGTLALMTIFMVESIMFLTSDHPMAKVVGKMLEYGTYGICVILGITFLAAGINYVFIEPIRNNKINK